MRGRHSFCLTERHNHRVVVILASHIEEPQPTNQVGKTGVPRTANAAIDANQSHHTLLPHLHCSLEIVGYDTLDQRLSHDLLCAVTNQSGSAFVPDLDTAEHINSKDWGAGHID